MNIVWNGNTQKFCYKSIYCARILDIWNDTCIQYLLNLQRNEWLNN